MMGKLAPSDKLPIIGGPLDGLKAKPAGGTIRFLEAKTDIHVVVHPEPGPGRHAYWRESTRWSFLGHENRKWLEEKRA